MKKRNPNPLDGLGKQTEAFPRNNPSAFKKLPGKDLQDLLEELRVHQVELEMQNEELRKSREEIEELKGIYEDLYTFAPVAYFTLDENNLIFSVNRAGAELLGVQGHRLLGSRFSRYISPDMMDRFYGHRRQCLDTGTRQICELKLKSNAENPRYVRLDSMAVPDNEGHVNRIRMAITEITDRKKEEEQIKLLSRELLQSKESECQMISRELHDTIAQDLSVIKLGFDSLLSDLPEIPSEIRRKNRQLSKMLQDTIIAVRDLSYELRPPDFERGEIVRPLSNLCREFSEKTGIKTDFFSAGMENITLDNFAMINIHRLVQEGVNNIRKHAEASHVMVTCSYDYPEIVISIIDNGKGFDVEKRLATITSERRMGLRNMEERIRLLGGTIAVHSQVMGGTSIRIRLPYEGKIHG